MFRFANSAKDDPTGGKEHLHRFIKDVFGNSVPTFSNSIDFISGLKEGFKNCLKDYFIDTFTLEREKGQFFALYFFTSHIKGFEKMLETKWELDEQQGRGFRFEKTGTLFDLAETNDWEGKLKEFILSGNKYNSDVYSFSLHNGFLPKHTNQILKSWQDSGTLTVIASEGERARKGAFYLTYDCYNGQPKKVSFKLQ